MENNDIIESIRELLAAIFIQSQRNYDMLSIIADKLGADAISLTKMHSEGQVLAPAPSFIFEDEDNPQVDTLFNE
jgi:hypothetical protein